MLNIFKFLLKPLKMEYLMLVFATKTIVMIFSICWLMVVANAVPTSAATLQQQHQPQTLNYKQQLHMQKHHKFEYQQHIKQQQQYHQQNTPTAMALMQEQHQQHQQLLQHQQHPQYLAIFKPTQMLETAASLVDDDGSRSENLTKFLNGNAQRNIQGKHPGTRKNKRRPQVGNITDIEGRIASNSPSNWLDQVEDDRETLNIPSKSSTAQPQDVAETMRNSSQASFKGRKQSDIGEPLVILEKEQKLYEMRNKIETPTEDNADRNSSNLKNILKNSIGLGLSEILQQKNLSLKDNALQALQATATPLLEKLNHTNYPFFKLSFKSNTSSIKLTEGNEKDIYNSKDRSKLTALHRLKLFDRYSRSSGIQVGLSDHLTVSPTSSTSTPKPSTTEIHFYKKILHQRPILKNTTVMPKTEMKSIVTSWYSKGKPKTVYIKPKEEMKDQEGEEKIELMEDDEDLERNMLEISTKLSEINKTSTWKIAMAPTTSSYTTNTTTPRYVTKSTSEKSTTQDTDTSTRRIYNRSQESGRTTNHYKTSITTPAITTTTSTTITSLPKTTTTTTSTITRSSNTMNLTPTTHLNLNIEDLRKPTQDTLLKSLIATEDSLKKFPIVQENDDGQNDLENFFEETIKPKSTKYFETSNIITRMKKYTPVFLYPNSTSTSTSTPVSTSNPRPNENINVIPYFDTVDDSTDLLDFIENRRSGDRLLKVLEQRNMTLEKLIEHRKRGSSQLQINTILESPSKLYPDKRIILQDRMDIVTAVENFPHFNLFNIKHMLSRML